MKENVKRMFQVKSENFSTTVIQDLNAKTQTVIIGIELDRMPELGELFHEGFHTVVKLADKPDTILIEHTRTHKLVKIGEDSYASEHYETLARQLLESGDTAVMLGQRL